MDFKLFGLTISGDGTTIEDAVVEAIMDRVVEIDEETTITVPVPCTYGLNIEGPNATISGVTFKGGQNSALFLEGDTEDSVTTIENCKFEGFSKEIMFEGETETVNYGASGLKFRNFKGTVNISNVTFEMCSNAMELGPNGGRYDGTLSISDSNIKTTTFSISTVDSAKLTNVTMGNPNGTLGLYVGGKTNSFEGCTFTSLVKFQSPNFANKTVAIAFNNCDYNGTEITAENILEYFDFSHLAGRDKLTVTVNGASVAVDN